MRVIRVLSGIVLTAMFGLALLGCGGGGTPNDPGTALINDTSKTITYTPGTGVTPDFVYAKFESTNPTTHPTLESVGLKPIAGGLWALNFASTTSDFNSVPSGSYIGEYYATVYGIFSNQSAPIQLGYRTLVLLDITVGSGGGPPPPPVF